jgi:hypothetical protein
VASAPALSGAEDAGDDEIADEEDAPAEAVAEGPAHPASASASAATARAHQMADGHGVRDAAGNATPENRVERRAPRARGTQPAAKKVRVTIVLAPRAAVDGSRAPTYHNHA